MEKSLWNNFQALRGRFSQDDFYSVLIRNYYVYSKSNNYDEYHNYLQTLVKDTDYVTSPSSVSIEEVINSLYSLGLDDTFLNNLYNLFSKNKSEDILDFLFEQYGSDILYETPTEINQISSEILGKNQNTIIDYCSGRGAFLNDYYKYSNKTKFLGIELNHSIALDSKILLDLKNTEYEVYTEDALNYNSLFKSGKQYDAIYSNFPFNLRSNNKYIKSYSQEHWKNFKFENLQGRSLDWHFVGSIVNLLSENGKAVALMTPGNMFRINEAGFRKELLDFELIEMIIELPTNLLNYTTIPTLLIVFSMNNKDVTLINAKDAFFTNRNKNKLDVNKVKKLIKEEDSNKKIIKNNNELIKNDSQLLPSKYLLQNDFTFSNGKQFDDFTKDIFRGVQISSKELDKMSLLGEGSKVTNYSVISLSNLDSTIAKNDLQHINAPKGKYDRYLIKNEDILITARGTKTKVTIADIDKDENIIATGNLIVIRVDKNVINPIYLYMFLTSVFGEKALESIKVGTVIMSINPKNVKSLKMPFISKQEQDILAQKYLAKRDNLEILKERMVKLKNQLHTMFVDEVEVD